MTFSFYVFIVKNPGFKRAGKGKEKERKKLRLHII